MSHNLSALEAVEKKRLIEREFTQVRSTVRSFDFLSDLLGLFLPE